MFVFLRTELKIFVSFVRALNFFLQLNLSSDNVGTCSLGWLNPANFTTLAEWGWRSPGAVSNGACSTPRGGRVLLQVCWSLGVLWRFLMLHCVVVCWEILLPWGKAADTGTFQAKLSVGLNTKSTAVFFWCDVPTRTDSRNSCISRTKWIKQEKNERQNIFILLVPFLNLKSIEFGKVNRQIVAGKECDHEE